MYHVYTYVYMFGARLRDGRPAATGWFPSWALQDRGGMRYLSIYLFIHLYISLSMCIYIYIYIYT